MRVYLDSAVVIYTVERSAAFGPAVAAKLASLGPYDIVSSELVRMESLVLPVRNANNQLIQDFEAYFRTMVAEWVPFDRVASDQTVVIRAGFSKIKTPDAIHLASAVVAGCDLFPTNESALQAYTGIRVELI